MNSPAVIAFPTQLTAAATTAINHESETDIIAQSCLAANSARQVGVVATSLRRDRRLP
jgi:hypothetical protein